jgi:hypothetical protein
MTSPPPPRIGFLHTAHVHVARFDALLATEEPSAEAWHLVDETLLADARTDPANPRFLARLHDRLDETANRSDVMICTCSTIGGLAEHLWGERRRTQSAGTTAPLIRVDRPVFEAALRFGSDVGVIVAVESTIGPTVALLHETAQSMDVSARPVVRYLEDAWPLFESGDHTGYLRAVAQGADELAKAGSVDVIVLAQASMAEAIDLCQAVVPVLSSPHLAVRAALTAARPR